MSNLHAGHRKRVMEEFRKCGLSHFPQHKMLELLLYYSIPRGDTNPIGHRLIDRFGSLSGVFDAPIGLLEQVEGVGPKSAGLIKLVAALIREYMEDYTRTHDVIDSPQAAKEYMLHKFLCETHECVVLACLAFNGRVIYCDRVAEGSPETVSIVPADIVRRVVHAGGVKALLAHNHPGGFCNPSSKDLRATSILNDELQRVDVELIDHVIVAPDGVYSMKENHMFPSRTQGL